MQRIMKDFPVRELDPKFFNDNKNEKCDDGVILSNPNVWRLVKE